MSYGITDIIRDELRRNASYVDEQTYANRMAECEKCEHLSKVLHNCKLCGCFVKAKTKYKLSKCPDTPARW